MSKSSCAFKSLCKFALILEIMKMTDSNDPDRGGESNQNNGFDGNGFNGRLSPQLNGHANGNEIHSESEEDNESPDENEHSGYVLLPQNEVPNIPNNEDSDNDETLEEILQRVQQQPALEPSPQIQSMIQESQRNSEIEAVQERDTLFSQTSRDASNSRNTIDMSGDRVDTIRSVMSGFQLPPNAIPPWAVNLSEDEIQKVLRDKLSDVMSVSKRN